METAYSVFVFNKFKMYTYFVFGLIIDSNVISMNLYRPGLLKTLVKELAKYRSDGTRARQQGEECTVFCGKGNESLHLARGFFVPRGVASAFK